MLPNLPNIETLRHKLHTMHSSKLEMWQDPTIMTLAIIIGVTFGVLTSTTIVSKKSDVQAQTLDVTPPSTTAILNPSSPDGNNDWYITPLQITLNATDLETGVKSINYKIDSGSWQTIDFSGTSNLVTNPSFETSGATTTGTSGWEATVEDPEGNYSKDATNSATGYASSSMKIETTGGAWHGVNNLSTYSPTIAYDNMTSSVWLKSDSITGSATMKIYAVVPDGGGGYTYQYITEHAPLSGTNDWTLSTLDFNVNVAGAEGVYVDIGLVGPGSLWVDAVSVSTSLNTISTNFTVATDSAEHTVEYYSEDFAGNVEESRCIGSTVNCIEFKLDQTPPGNWQNSGAVRQIGGGSSAEHELWVFTDVEDLTSGLSTNTDEYQYHTSTQDSFGYYSNLLGCNSTWNADAWVALEDAVTSDGTTRATLRTQKTDFCDSNWKICKDVRFYAEDMAGNIRTKDLCLNGPWVKVRGGGHVRSNAYIDMVSESSEDNTDGLIEINGISVDFFTSDKDWEVHNSPIPSAIDYDYLYTEITATKTEITDGEVVSATGVYEVNGDLTLGNQEIPNDYDSATFDQIVFVDGNLTLESNIEVGSDSTALFIVSGNVFIDESLDVVGVALIADGNIETAYNLSEGSTTKTLNLSGIYIAEEIMLQRTLQGTQNNDTPSESFVFEPKYSLQLKQFFDNSTIRWVAE